MESRMQLIFIVPVNQIENNSKKTQPVWSHNGYVFWRDAQ